MARESLEILRAWYQSVVQGRKQNTYKLALGLSILEGVRREQKKGVNGAIKLQYGDITDQWVEFYWDHTSVFKLRQSVNSEKPPEILQILRNYMDKTDNWGKFWKKLDIEMRAEIRERVMQKAGFIDNPISRLPVDHQTKSPGGDPIGHSQFYSWDKGRLELEVTPVFSSLIKSQYPILADIVIPCMYHNR